MLDQPAREPILNVPAVVVVLLALLGLVHGVLAFLLTTEQATEFLLLFAFIPALSADRAARRQLAGRMGRRRLDLCHLCIDPCRSQSLDLQRGVALGLRHAGGPPDSERCGFSRSSPSRRPAGAAVHLAAHFGEKPLMVGASAAISGAMAAAMPVSRSYAAARLGCSDTARTPTGCRRFRS